MGSIRIQDTGYIKPTNEGTQATASNRVDSGSAVILKAGTFIPSLKRNLAFEPDIGSNIPSEINIGSLENMKFQIKCVLSTKSSTDMALLQHLLDAIATDGYKVMWYNYASATTENNDGQLLYQIALNSKFGHQFTNGEKSAFGISDNFYHLHVLLFDIQPRHTGKIGFIQYTLLGIVLKVEDSAI